LRAWQSIHKEEHLQRIEGGTITSPQGFVAGAAYAGLKVMGEDLRDVGILFSEAPCLAAAVYTSNVVKAAPLVVTQEHLRNGRARALVVNSGNANACTGEQGRADAREMAALTAKKVGIATEEVAVASTGVIGVPMPMEQVRPAIERISLSREGGHELARAIVTTDTFTKEIAVAVRLGDGRRVMVGGIAKGAGMIHPNMATLLGFVATDAALSPDFVTEALTEATDSSFNVISVDGDTSTNDNVVLFANGLAGNAPIAAGTPDAEAFQLALNEVCIYLAKSIARDGEGASRLLEVTVQGALTVADARKAARGVVSSSLLKAAVYGADPNWGRVLMALGNSGAAMIEEKTDLYMGEVCLMKSGRPMPFDRDAASRSMTGKEVAFQVHLNMGEACATAWGCDLTEQYVIINSAYTT